MVLLGSLVNSLCIIVGSLIGLFFTNIPERFKQVIIHGVGLVVIFIGLEMVFYTQSIIVLLLSVISGAVIGECMHLEKFLNKFGNYLGEKTSLKNNSNISQAFVTSTLFFVIGAMSILGALDSGLRGDHSILITKGIMDSFIAIIFTTTLGFGVILCVIPLLLFQGSIAIFASKVNTWIPESLIDGMILELTAIGGLLILGIGLNLLEVTKIKIANLLPSIITVVIFYYIFEEIVVWKW